MIDLVPGAVIAGKYRLEREIGRGGMGSVWSARHLQLDTLVALKFVDPGSAAADAHLRFEREAKAAAQLRSPHVVQILDHGVDGELPYIAMELLEGEDLGERLRRAGRLSIPEASRIFGQAAKALRRAHDAGVIHRDLKPSNIFLARFDEDEVVKLLDFGVAKLRRLEMDPQNPATQTGVIFGSPTYMSPEQARGNKAIDHRSDLWSLAVILFRALTGQKPFEANSIGDLVIKLCIEPPPVPSRIATDLPPEIDRFFERAFARDPDQRFPSAMAMAAELEAIAQRGPSEAAVEPPSALAPRPSATPPSGLSAPFVVPPIAPQIVVPVLPVAVEPAGFVPPSQPTPASMTPSPTLLAPRPAPSAPSSRTPLIAAAALGTIALLLLVGVVAALRGRAGASSQAAPLTSDPTVNAPVSAPLPASEESAALAPGAPPVESAAPTVDASAQAAASAPSPEAPTGSASADPSARGKPATGKSGRGRVPNFGY